MKRTLSILLVTAAAALVLSSCAKAGSDNPNAAADRVLAAWVKVNYGENYAPNDSGVFILSLTQGTGAAVPDSGYVFCHYTRRSLEGNIASTNDEALTEQLGLKTNLTDCGSDIWQVDQGMIPCGLEAVIKSLRVGGKARVALPVAQSVVTNSTYNAFSASESDNVIYDIELDDVVADIYAWQDGLLKAHSAAHYGGMDTLTAGYYFKVVGQAAEPDSINDDVSVSCWYIGRRLDGRVFDTNVRDTARKYEIYSSAGSYDSLALTYYKDFSTMLSNNSYAMGFTKAIHEMRKRDTVEVFFRSDWGYGASGSTTVIPEYCPLCFRIWFTQTTNGDEN
ncbi:MAG: FKBP-type peptidyl-prolyl cis-trans isomerase [Bacteroidales bacterium]|nr:FKBP-type peptidyl-prolyl cis-trans isomerase [Bacteroidales bacterium]